MKINFKEQTKDNILAYTISGILIVLCWFFFSRFDAVASFFSKVGSALAPFLWGMALAFIMLPMRRVVENKWLKQTDWKPKTKRKVAVTAALVVFILILAAFFSVLIPQLIDSSKTLVDSMDSYMTTLDQFIDKMSTDPDVLSLIENLYNGVRTAISDWFNGTSGMISSIVTYSVGFVKGIFNFFVGIIIAVYLMLDQERWKRQAKKVIYAVCSEKHAEHIGYVWHLTISMLNSFIFGKALDSLIIGIVCGICCAVMKIPYTPLIAFVIGLTNMIPVFGPFIGAIPCIFILLIIDPWEALEFGIFILILQQIDGNILGPYILGDSLGLPALWVMFAIIAGGAMFGIAGMFLGVPIFSVIYVLIRDHTARKLREKRISIQ